MARVLVEELSLEHIADAIREKNGEETTYKPAEMANAILDIEAYPEPTGTKSITANGTGIDVKDYASADVNVPNSYSQSDEGKVVDNGALVSQTSDTVTENDTYDTTLIKSLTVNVSGGGGSANGFPVVEKYVEDMQRGFVSSGTFYYNPSDPTRCDVWKVRQYRKYLVVLGNTVGNRFRVMFSAVDPSTTTSDISGTHIVSGNDPEAYAISVLAGSSGGVPFSPSTDGYITTGKTNQDVTGIACYLIDVTDPPTSGIPSAEGVVF